MPSVESLINATQGPFWEIGGPTQSEHRMPYIDFSKIDKPLVCTNVDFLGVNETLYRHPLRQEEVIDVQRPEGRLWRPVSSRQYVTDRGWGEAVYFAPELWIDATDIIRGAGELGALYTVSLPHDIELKFFNEAARTLEPGGVLVVEHTKRMRELPWQYFKSLSSKRVGAGAVHFAAQRNERPFGD